MIGVEMTGAAAAVRRGIRTLDKAANDNAGFRASTSKRKCPICGKLASVEVTPFCSKRCADVDLHRWLGEGYRVPVSTDDEDERGSRDDE